MRKCVQTRNGKRGCTDIGEVSMSKRTFDLTSFGFVADEASRSYYRKQQGFMFVLLPVNSQYCLTTAVSVNGSYPDLKEMSEAKKLCEGIQSVTCAGYRVNFILKGRMGTEKFANNLAEALQFVPSFLKEKQCVGCSDSRPEPCVPGVYYAAGAVRLLKEEDYQQVVSSIARDVEEKNNKKENMVAGIVGALLGSLIGVAAILLISRLGFVAAVSGMIMGVCCLKGYELLGGKISRTGALICAGIMVVMVYMAVRLDWTLIIIRDLGWDFFTAFTNVHYVVKASDNTGNFIMGLVMNYLFTALGGAPSIVNAMQETDAAATAYVICRQEEEQF